MTDLKIGCKNLNFKGKRNNLERVMNIEKVSELNF